MQEMQQMNPAPQTETQTRRQSTEDLRHEGHHRMSQEERRQLRRDIHYAGKDLYRRPQRLNP
jgi:hypothetical protein